MNKLLRAAVLMVLVFGRAPVQAAPITQLKDAEIRDTAQSEENRKTFRHSLSGLYAIENFNSQPVQPYQDFDILYSKSHQAQFELENLCKETALLSNTSTCFAGIKSEQRALEKVTTELGGDASKITDIARATIIADDVSQLMMAYEVLQRESTIVKVKNRFKTPANSGYRDINMLVKLPKTNIIAEVQLHLREIAKVKSGPEHDIYEIVQGIERKAASEQRIVSDFEAAQINNLQIQSQHLYQQAWQQYLTPLRQAA